MTSPYVEYLLREKAGIVLTTSPTAKSATSLPTASTIPAASYPRPAGNIGDSTYLSLRHIDSARLMPIAFTLMRISCGPGAGTPISMNSRPSGPPACANLMVRDMMPPSSRFEGVGIGTGANVSPPHGRLRGRLEKVSGKVEDLFRSGQEAHEAIAGFEPDWLHRLIGVGVIKCFHGLGAIELDDNPAAVRDDAIQRLRVFAAHENPAAVRCDDVRNARAVALVGRRIGDLDFDKEIPFGHGLTPVLAGNQSRGCFRPMRSCWIATKPHPSSAS